MNKTVLFIMLFLMPAIASAQEVIAEMDAAGIATMNEELRQSSSGLKNLKGQVADLLPLDLSDTTKVENALPIANGGTGQTTAQAAINALTGVSSATNEYVLTKDTATGNAVFKELPKTVPDNSYTAGGTYLLVSADTERLFTNPSTYTKAKSIIVPRSGTYRVSRAVRAYDGRGTYQRVYKNGVAFSDETFYTNTSYQTFTNDLFFEMGDTVEYWGWAPSGGGGNSGYVKEFRLYALEPSTFTVITD